MEKCEHWTVDSLQMIHSTLKSSPPICKLFFSRTLFLVAVTIGFRMNHLGIDSFGILSFLQIHDTNSFGAAVSIGCNRERILQSENAQTLDLT